MESFHPQAKQARERQRELSFQLASCDKSRGWFFLSGSRPVPFLVQTRERTCTIKCRTKGGRDGAYPPNIVYMEYMYAAMQEIPQKEKKSTRLSIAYVQRNLKVAPCMCH